MTKNNLKIKKLSVLATVGVLILGQFAIPWVESGSFSLLFEISSTKSSFLVGEPVPINFELTNTGVEDIFSDLYLTFAFDRLSVFISKDGGEFEPYLSQAMQNSGFKKQGQAKILLQGGGGIISSSELISFNTVTGDFAFPSPGSYQIKSILTFNHYQDTVESNIIAITVNSPSGDDLLALDFLKTNGIEMFLTDEWRLFSQSLDESVITKVEEFQGSFPVTVYSPFVDLSPKSDLSIIKQVSEPVLVDGTISYKLTVHNNGPENPENVIITDSKPDGLLFNTAKSSGSCLDIGDTISCEISPMDIGFFGEVIVAFDVPEETMGIIENEAIVSSSTPDPSPSNNIFIQKTNIDTTPPTIPVGGELIPLDTTMVLVAGAQNTASWMIPVIVSGIGIGIVIARKF